MFDIMQVLKDNGWYEGRNIDISKYEEFYQSKGFPLHEAAKKTIAEFGGLYIKANKSYETSDGNIVDSERDIVIDPISLWDEAWIIKSYSTHFKISLIPIVLDEPAPWIVYIGENGCFYACGDCTGICLNIYSIHDVLDFILNTNDIELNYESIDMIE